MRKFISSVIVVLLLSISLLPVGSLAYDDVDHKSPNYYAIEYLRRNKVVPEGDLFHPDKTITRAEFIQFLVKLNSPDFEPGKANLPFSDTRNDEWYSPYFHEAIQLGILDDREEKAHPNQKLKVIDAIRLLFHSKSIPIPRKHVGPILYKDVKRNKRSQAMIMRALDLGVAQPERNDYFGIYRRVTKEKAASLIYRMELVDLRDGAPNVQAIQTLSDSHVKKITDVWQLITENYVDKDDVDKDALIRAAVDALIEELGDPYSVYLDAEQNTSFNDEFDGEIEGIGAFIGIEKDNEITIVSPIAGSPAERAGVKAGDVVFKVDGFDVSDSTLHEAVQRIKGPKGTTVHLTLKRNGSIVELEVVRDVIEIKAIEYELVGSDNFMHIKLLTFNQNLVREFRDVVEIVQNNSKIKGVIIDVRNNPGGLLDAAIGVLNYMLPSNAAAVHVNYNFFNFTQFTTGKGELADVPMVVLINKGSASASEIVAGALKDHGIARVVGETTFGKGTVQEINSFPDQSSLKLTVAKWLTPEGHSIQDNGISPHIKVINTQDDFDRQLDRAISELTRLTR